MSRVQEALADLSPEPVIDLLIVGKESEESRDIKRQASEVGVYRRVERRTPGDADLSSVTAFAKEAGLYAGKYRSCLLVVWDFDELNISEPWNSGLELLRQSGAWSPQLVGFGLTRRELPLSSVEMADLSAVNISGVGDLEACLSTLRAWSDPVAERGSSSLRRPFLKAPSQWIREIHHVYLNTVIGMKDRLEGLGLVTQQRIIDFWQEAVRNVLVYPLHNSPARAFAPQEEDDLPGDVSDAVLLAPVSLHPQLEMLNLEPGLEIAEYDAETTIDIRLAELKRTGRTAVLLLRAGEIAQQDILNPADPAPSLLVGERAPRLTWDEWKRAHSANILGSISYQGLISTTDRGVSLLETKRRHWMSFGQRTLSEAWNEVVELIAETYLAVRMDASAERDRLYRSLAAAEAARAHYFSEGT